MNCHSDYTALFNMVKKNLETKRMRLNSETMFRQQAKTVPAYAAMLNGGTVDSTAGAAPGMAMSATDSSIPPPEPFAAPGKGKKVKENMPNDACKSYWKSGKCRRGSDCH